jgi:multiple sugar transport system permease protein
MSSPPSTIGRSVAVPGALKPRRRTRRFRRVAVGYVLVAPAVIAAGVFLYGPMVVSGYWSFTEFHGIGEAVWVGLDNYREILGDEQFRHALLNTAIFVVLGQGTGPIFGLASAILLNRSMRLRGLFRAAYFLPVMVSLVVAATIWKILLTESGIVNQVFRFLHLPTTQWLENPSTALPAIVVTSVWQGFGFETVIFLAALQAIPRDLYDAAFVDGATAWERFRYVTLPALRPTIAFVYVIGVIGTFQVYDQIFVMSNGTGGPIDSTRTIVFDLVERFQRLKLGEASAVAYILLVILATLSFVQLRLFERRS